VEIVGFLLAALIGISLGLLGGGGSILAVPILVYVVGMTAKSAIATSLLVVGTTSLVGAIRHWRATNIDLRSAVIFGVVSMAGSFAGGRLAALVSDTFQLVLFAIVMIGAAISMFRSRSEVENADTSGRPALLVIAAAAVGVLTGVVGVGGGFLIVPALVLFAGLPMKRAVGTSLLVIAMNSGSGFLAYANHVEVDWRYTALFTGMAVIGVVIGSAIMPFVSQAVLKRGFAVFLIAVAGFILYQSQRTKAESHSFFLLRRGAVPSRSARLYERRGAVPSRSARLYERRGAVPSRSARLYERRGAVPSRSARLYERRGAVPSRSARLYEERSRQLPALFKETRLSGEHLNQLRLKLRSEETPVSLPARGRMRRVT